MYLILYNGNKNYGITMHSMIKISLDINFSFYVSNWKVQSYFSWRKEIKINYA
jgi:hypothetical protein